MRRAWLVLLAFLAGCPEHGMGGEGMCVVNGHPHQIGEVFPAGDGCNTCTCTASGPSCTKQACPDVLTLEAGTSAGCEPSGGCPSGPACDATCCKSGERCVSGVCMCAGHAACTLGDMCTSPIVSQDGCGSVCCGATGPCPAGPL
jgi:hypothetical protein